MISDFTDWFNVCAHPSNITAQRNTAKQTQRNTGFNTRDFNRLNKIRSYFCCSPLALSCFEINIFPSFPSFIRQSVHKFTLQVQIQWLYQQQKAYKNPTRPGPCRMLVRFLNIHVAYMKCNGSEGLKWPIFWIVYHIYMVCYNFSDFLWYIVQLWHEEKEQKKFMRFKGKKEKKQKNRYASTGVKSGPAD